MLLYGAKPWTAKKVHEKRLYVTEMRMLQQYGHVEKIEENYIGKRAAKMRVDGNKVRGIPKKRRKTSVSK